MSLGLLEDWRAELREAAMAAEERRRALAAARAEQIAAAIEGMAPGGAAVAEAKLEVILWRAGQAFETAPA